MINLFSIRNYIGLSSSCFAYTTSFPPNDDALLMGATSKQTDLKIQGFIHQLMFYNGIFLKELLIICRKKIGKLRPAKTVPKIKMIKDGKKIKLHNLEALGHLKNFQGEADK